MTRRGRGLLLVRVSQCLQENKRLTVLAAYGNVMHLMCIIATVMAIPPIIFACFMPNWTLGDEQNAVDKINLAGELEREMEEQPAGAASGSKAV